MQYSLNWLKELSQSKKTASEIAQALTLHSFEVEGIEKVENNLKKIVVGEIREIKKHPNADKLQVTLIDIGKKKLLQIVTGAPNIKVGQKVPVALEGAQLSNGLKIKATQLRGERSEGMLCAEDELGLGSDHSGIMILKPTAPIGKNLADYLKLISDQILEIDILPNRAHDCLSHWGVAREIAAVENRKFQDKIKTEVEKVWKKIKTFNKSLPIEIETRNCQRYTGVQLDNIKIKSSPLWLQSRLRASGIQPINNVVDITNYVMLEVGQPLHAFSGDLLEMPLKIRQAQSQEKLQLLNGEKIVLDQKDLVIADQNKVIALTGIMGGKNSGINSKTQTIILEAASFQAAVIRRTARRYNLSTEASYRFERDLDPNLTQIALTRAVKLLTELAEAKIKVWQDIYPKKVKPWIIRLKKDRIEKLLGIKISQLQIKNILKNLDLKVKSEKNSFQVIIPTFRKDLQTPEDLIEEIGRLYGYEKIKPKPLRGLANIPELNQERIFERKIKDLCVASGYDEIKGYSFYSKKDAQALKLDTQNHLPLFNPSTSEQAWMRRSLAVALLKSARISISYFKKIKTFELGKIYIPQKTGLPQEVEKLGALVVSSDTKGEQFYELKGLAENIFQFIGLKSYYWDDSFKRDELKIISHPARKALIKTNQNQILGYLIEINKRTSQYFGIKKKRVAFLEIDINLLRKVFSEERFYQPLKKFPSINRDISLKVPAYTRVADVERIIYQAGGNYLQDVNLFDLYIDGETLERSVGFHLIFQSDKRTLSREEVDKAMENIFKVLEEELEAEVKRN